MFLWEQVEEDRGEVCRQEIEVTQRQVRALEYYTSTYACPECEKETGYPYLFLALTELPYLGKNPSQENLDAFMLWNAKIRNICSASKSKPPAGDL